MENRIIEKSVEINAPLKKVWSLFTDRAMAEEMGGYYDTDWDIGSPFGFRDINGDRLTNGVLLGFRPGQLIRHSLFEKGSETVMAIICYSFHEKDGATLLTGSEVLSQQLDKSTFDEVSEDWLSVLNAVKDLAEAS